MLHSNRIQLQVKLKGRLQDLGVQCLLTLKV